MASIFTVIGNDMPDLDRITVAQMLPLLAFMGDMSMGQPFGHSMRVSRRAGQLAAALGLDVAAVRAVRQVALLRWVGCTANASEVAAVMRDDVTGRQAMLALRPERMALQVPPAEIGAHAHTLSSIHCEVSAVITSALGLSDAVTEAIQCLFEQWDGQGFPRGLAGQDVPLPVLLTVLAGDLEILPAEYGPAGAAQLLQRRADVIYPRSLVELAMQHAADEAQVVAAPMETDLANEPAHEVALALLADTIELKLPWLAGYSRAVASVAHALGGRLALPPETQAALGRAALLHGLGRVSVPNAVWNQAGSLTRAEWEQVRLGPYWTARAATLVPSLAMDVELAAYAYERLDGSGYFRAASAATTPLAYRVLPVACAWVALRSSRPWRAALSDDDALRQLRAEGPQRFDPHVVDALVDLPRPAAPTPVDAAPALLSSREREVLQSISRGSSNKEAARELGLSPATVRTHMESIFRKLACNSRAAATLKASMLGLLG